MDISDQSRPLLTPEEYWEGLHRTLGRGAIYRYLELGKIRSIRVGKRFLIPRSEIEEFPMREAQREAT